MEQFLSFSISHRVLKNVSVNRCVATCILNCECENYCAFGHVCSPVECLLKSLQPSICTHETTQEHKPVWINLILANFTKSCRFISISI